MTSSSGNSSRATSEAEYTDAPCSLTETTGTFVPSFSSTSRTNASASRLPVPLPTAISSGWCFCTAAASWRAARARSSGERSV